MQLPNAQMFSSNPAFPSFSLIHLFSWSGLIDANILLNDLFKVPNLQTGRMEPLITALSPEEEEMACNMLRRLNTIFSVSPLKIFYDQFNLKNDAFFQMELIGSSRFGRAGDGRRRAILFPTCYFSPDYGTNEKVQQGKGGIVIMNHTAPS